MKHEDAPSDAIVIGGGLAGLAAALELARRRQRVTLLESAGELGGRGRTKAMDGFALNLGAHALYRGGGAAKALRRFGLLGRIKGQIPPVRGLRALFAGETHVFPAEPLGFLETKLLPAKAKLEFARAIALLMIERDREALDHEPTARWLDRRVSHPRARGLFEALFRASTYSADFERLPARVAISQLRIASLANVLYVDGGWASIVKVLADACEAARVTIRTNTSARRILHGDGTLGVLLDGGEELRARTVIATTPPKQLGKLVPSVRRLADFAPEPLEAACLDLLLTRVPNATAALGIDAPTYYSVHSRTAALAPLGSATVHAIRYGGGEPIKARAELEALAERIDPGYRAFVRFERFLPAMNVVSHFPDAAQGGLSSRLRSEVPEVPGLFLAGDSIGERGFLADTCFFSAARAVELALAERPRMLELAAPVTA